MPAEPHWTAYLTAFSTPTLAVVAAFIALRQWFTAHNKFKLDLFDKRYKIYEEAKAFLASVFTSGRVTQEALFKFMGNTREAKWLFNDDVATFLRTQIYNKALDIQQLEAELEGVPVGEERSQNLKKQRELKDWLRRQFDLLDEMMGPFLQIDQSILKYLLRWTGKFLSNTKNNT